MGCEESRTIDDGAKKESKVEQQKAQKVGENLIVKTLTGLLDKNSNERFHDCLIESGSDLEDKLRIFIPTSKPDENNPNNFVRNVSDDIVTQSLKIDFSQCSIIAMSGIQINYVSNSNGNYLVRHDGIPESSGTYCAVVVKRIPGNPQIVLASPKPTPTD